MSAAPRRSRCEAILRRPLMVAPQIPVLDLLLQMRQARMHLALVVDEYGGIDGLVTIEDLVETIIGDIADEHDEVEGPMVTERPTARWTSTPACRSRTSRHGWARC